MYETEKHCAGVTIIKTFYNLTVQLNRCDEIVGEQLRNMIRNVSKLNNTPGRRLVTNENEKLLLSTYPRTLHVLRTEYAFGSPGKKTAKDFTISARGKVKYLY